MSEEILINHTSAESRVAVLEEGVLQELYIERHRSRGIVGNIYRGKVIRVLPGMQAAFIDVGLDKACFLHASDIVSSKQGDTEHKVGQTPDIRNLLHEGKKVVVQVLKDSIGSKGARVTTHLSVSARYLVYMPYTNHLGVSQRLEDEEERERLKTLTALVQEDMQMPGGFIVRTVADGISEQEVRSDMQFLKRLWAAVDRRVSSYPVPSKIYGDLPLVHRSLRDLVSQNVEKIRIDDEKTFEELKEFCDEYVPQLSDALEFYKSDRQIFDVYNIDEEIEKALNRKVILKSGGYLIIDQTEAMTTIDVNTGAYVGRRNLEETIFKTNLEAVSALCRQLRVRNLGGMVIIDFIDMKDDEHKRKVHQALEKCLEKDSAKTSITGVSELGLVEMTRKRTQESLERILCEPCPVCQGRGMLRTAETVCYEIFREILREAREYDSDSLMVLAEQSVVDRLLDEESSGVADLEAALQKTIRFQVENMYNREQFDIVLF